MSLGASTKKAARNLDLIPKVKIQMLGRLGPLSVWLVDGKMIRDKIYLDFTEGGNSKAFPWMPPREIWIDNANQKELGFILLHELTEYNEISKGIQYEHAHEDYANVQEQMARDHPQMLEHLLALQEERLNPKTLRLALVDHDPFQGTSNATE